MRLIAALASALVLGVLAGVFAGAAAQTPAVTPEQVQARFADMSLATARSLGYTLTSNCVVRPTDGAVMGYHAYRPGSLDDSVDPLEPEILLLVPHGGSLRVVGAEWEAVGAGPFTLFGEKFHEVEGHPGMWFSHHALHLYFEPELQFAEFNPALAGACTQPPVIATAAAHLKDSSGETVGIVTLEETSLGVGVVEISLDAFGLAPGVHAVHIHAVGSCVGPDFTSAGGHFNPFARSHGVYFTPDGPHAGDIFGSGIVVAPNGMASWRDASERFSLSGSGPSNLFDADGAAVVVHISSDDHQTDPTGNAGARIACGVIERVQETPAAPHPTPTKPAPAPISPPSTGSGGLQSIERDDEV